MQQISLKDFAITGRFGPVSIGMTKNQVIDLLGQPEEENDFNQGSSGLTYSWYEFFYWTDTEIVYAIQNDHLTTWPYFKGKAKRINHINAIYFKNEKFELDIWFLKPGKDICYEKVIEILDIENIRYKEIENPSSVYMIEFESGVRLDFNDESNRSYKDGSPIILKKNKQVLNGIRLFNLK